MNSPSNDISMDDRFWILKEVVVRIPQPGLLQLDKDDLLRRCTRERLARRFPDYADESEYDASDPAWIILEQSTWLRLLCNNSISIPIQWFKSLCI